MRKKIFYRNQRILEEASISLAKNKFYKKIRGDEIFFKWYFIGREAGLKWMMKKIKKSKFII